MHNFLCVLYLTGFRMGDMFRLKRENLSKDWLEIIEKKNNVQRFKYYTKTLTYFLNRALDHSALMAEKYLDGDVSDFVFTNRYGKPLTYFGLRSAIRIAGNPFPLRQIRALYPATPLF